MIFLSINTLNLNIQMYLFLLLFLEYFQEINQSPLIQKLISAAIDTEKSKKHPEFYYKTNSNDREIFTNKVIEKKMKNVKFDELLYVTQKIEEKEVLFIKHIIYTFEFVIDKKNIYKKNFNEFRANRIKQLDLFKNQSQDIADHDQLKIMISRVEKFFVYEDDYAIKIKDLLKDQKPKYGDENFTAIIDDIKSRGALLKTFFVDDFEVDKHLLIILLKFYIFMYESYEKLMDIYFGDLVES